MSRAFTKEVDDAPPPPPLERPVSGAPNRVTPAGARQIAERVAALDEAIARGNGNAEDLIREQHYWSARAASMQVVPYPDAPDAVGFGTQVDIIRRGKTLSVSLVGEDEADPASGLIAWTSPLARAIEGAEPGEAVPFEAGGHEETISVVAVRNADRGRPS